MNGTELPVTTAGYVARNNGALYAAGTAYGLVTVGLDFFPVGEARDLAALIILACDAAEEWQATQQANQAAHDATRATGGTSGS